MTINEILLEFNDTKLINDFGLKVLAHISADSSARKIWDKAQDMGVGNNPISKDIYDAVIKDIASLDPTPNKKLSFWLVNKYANNKINRYEDIGSRAVPALMQYKQLLKKPKLEPPLQIRDINQIDSLNELETLLKPYEQQDDIGNRKEQEKEFYNSGQAELVYNDNDIKVVVPKSQAASCFFGTNTKWCTAAKKYNAFDEYNNDGPLYIILIKKENKRFQFHFSTDQFMNEYDDSVDPQLIANMYPKLWKIFELISIKNNSLMFVKNPSEELAEKIISEDPSNIYYIDNPSEKLQLSAVQTDPKAIGQIKNPTVRVQKEALYLSLKTSKISVGQVLSLIRNPTVEIQQYAIMQSETSIKYIKNPSEDMQLFSIELYPSSISDIQLPSEKVQAAAVTKDPYVIRHIKNPTEKVQMIAINKSPKYIKMILNPSESVQLAAIKKDPAVINDIRVSALSIKAIQLANNLNKQPQNLVIR